MGRVIVAGALAALSFSTSASAIAQVRRRFDPESLQFEEPGLVRAELSIGAMRGEFAGRWLVPDFDVNIGLTPNVVIGVDSAMTVEGPAERLLPLRRFAPDNLWLSSKLGLWQSRDTAKWAFGAQLGPRLPLAPDDHGAGFQGVALLGRAIGDAHVVLNAGGLIEPGAEVSRERPAAVLVGLDVAAPLGRTGRWSLAVDLSSVLFVTPDRNQLAMTAGPLWAVCPWLDLGVSGVLGFLRGGDRYGAYLVVAPKLWLWGPPAPGQPP